MTSFYTDIQASSLAPGCYKVSGCEQKTGEVNTLYRTSNWQRAKDVARALKTMQAENKIIITG